MAKRTFAFVAVFAALLSVTLSVQAEDYNYYWSGASDSYYLTTANWNVGAPDGPQATVGLNTSGNNITAYMYNTNGVITLYNNSLGDSVYSLNIGKEDGTGNASLYYDHNSTSYNFTIDNGKTLSIYDGGTFTFAGAKRFVNNGTVNLNSGANFIVTEAELVVIDGANSVLNIKDGSTLSIDPITYIGTANNGATVNQTGGEATFNGRLALGWGDHSGYYNLSGGTLITTGEAGLWGANGSGISEFTVSGGTANFNKTGNSFEIGLGGSKTLANKFTLQGTGIVNVADTFAVKNSGILNIEGGEFNAPTITVDSTSTINMTDGALKTNAINMNGGTFTQGGGSLVYNGKLSVSGSAVLNGAIDMSKFLAKPNQTVTAVTTTNGVSGNYSINGAGWTSSIVDNSSIVATYAGDTNISYWNAVSNVYDAGSNWIEYKDGEWTQVSTTYIFGDSGTSYSNRDCYILPFYDSTDSTVQNVTVTFNNTYLRVNSITVGNGVGDDSTGTATVTRSGSLDVQTNLTINKGGAFSVSDALSVTAFNGTSGTLTVDGGTFSTNTTSVSGNLNVLDGTFTSTGAATINAGGNVSISGGTFNANSSTTVAGNLTVQNGTYNAKGTTTVNSGGKLTVNGGTFEFNNSNAQFEVKGDIDVLSGNLTITSSKGFRIGDYGKGTVNIEGGTVTVKSPTYMGVGASSDYVGTINQKTGSTVTFENVLALGWGNNVTGVYNLYGGTLTTTGATGLWCANPNGASTFNVTGGTANFNKAGNSFEIGLYQTYDPNQVANVFNLNSGTVNAADTFAIQYGGTLKVAKTDNNTLGDGVLNANKIDINNGGNLNMSSGTINLGAGGITNSTGASPKDYTITLSGGTFGTNNASWATSLDATISSNAVTFAPEAGKSITWRGVMSGAGALTKTEAGTLELFGANSFEGGTTISNGQISLHANGSLGTGAIAIDTNGSLTFTGDMTPQPKTIANAISGTGTIVKQGASNFTANLDGNLTGFSGNMIISGGTLSVLMNGTNRSLNVTNLSGPGNLELRLASGNGNTTLPKLTNNGFTGVISLVESGGSNGNKIDTGTKSFEGFTFNVNSGTTIYVDEAAFSANVNLSGTGNNEGHGALRLHNNMTGNITVMANNSVLGIDRTAVTVSGNIASGANSGETTLVIKSVVNDNGKGTFTGVISDGNAGSKLGVQLSGGRHTFSGANTYTGMTTVSAGVLELTGDAVVANGPVTVANDGTLEYNVANGQKKKLSIDATNKILSTGKVIKTGDGTLQLYSEAQGLIDISSLTVSSGQLDLKGYMTGGITVDAGGVFSPGNSVGEATFGGGYILKEGATLLIEQDGSGIDKLNVGSFTFQENSVSKNIELDITGIPFGAEYEIIKSTNPFTDDLLRDDYWLSHLKNELPEYMTLSVRGGNTVVLSIDRNQVPEPSTWALLILGAAGLLYWRKKKNA